MGKKLSASLPALRDGRLHFAEDERPAAPSAAALAVRFEDLPEELDAEQFELVCELADGPLPALPRAADDYLTKCLRVMDSALPRRARDESSGRLMLATYKRLLGGRSEDELNFLSKTAIEELEWFPSVKQCLAILKRWHRADEHAHRRLIAQRIAEKQQVIRREKFFAAMAEGRMPQERIDRLSDSQLAEARRRNLLEWNAEEKRFELRGASSS